MENSKKANTLRRGVKEAIAISELMADLYEYEESPAMWAPVERRPKPPTHANA